MTDEPDEPPMRTEQLEYPETLRLTLSDAKSMFDEALTVADAFEGGEDVAPVATRAFQDIDDIRVLLTDRRLEVLRAIHDEPPDSISDLADRLGRPYSVVHEDVAILAEHDIVLFQDGPRGAKQPYIPYETIRVDIPLVGSPVTAASIGPPPAREGQRDTNESEDKDRWLENAVDPRSESHS